MKKLVALLVVICGFAGIGFAQYSSCSTTFESQISGVPDTQSQSLGLSNFQNETAFNIWINPAQITEWQTVYGEIWGGAANTWGGANFKVANGHLGVFIGRPYTGTVANAANGSLYGLNKAVAGPGNAAVTGSAVVDNMTPLAITNNSLDIFYGVPLGNLSVGARLSMANNSLNDDYSYTGSGAATSVGDGSVSSKRLTSDMQIGLGALLKEMGPFEKLDVALTIAMPSVNNSYSLSCIETAATLNRLSESDELKTNAAANMSLLARGLLAMGSNKLYTTFGYQSIDISSKRTATADNSSAVVGLNLNKEEAFTDKTTNLMLDAAYHTQPSKVIKAIYTVGFRSSGQTVDLMCTDLGGQVANTVLGPTISGKQEVTTMSLPFSVAVEHQTWAKVCTRLGVQSTLMSNTKTKTTSQQYIVSGNPLLRDTAVAATSAETTTTPVAQPATVSLGFGIQPAKDFDLDVAIISTIFDLDSGAGVADLISRASLRYHF